MRKIKLTQGQEEKRHCIYYNPDCQICLKAQDNKPVISRAIIEEQLLDLLAISQHRKPGQVTHKIEEIKQLFKDQERRGEAKARKEIIKNMEEKLKDYDLLIAPLAEWYGLSYKKAEEIVIDIINPTILESLKQSPDNLGNDMSESGV